MTVERLPCGHHSGAFRERVGHRSESQKEGDGRTIIRGRCEICRTPIHEVYGSNGWLELRTIPR